MLLKKFEKFQQNIELSGFFFLVEFRRLRKKNFSKKKFRSFFENKYSWCSLFMMKSLLLLPPRWDRVSKPPLHIDAASENWPPRSSELKKTSSPRRARSFKDKLSPKLALEPIFSWERGKFRHSYYD